MIAFCIKHGVPEPTEKEINEQFTAAVSYARQKRKEPLYQQAKRNEM